MNTELLQARNILNNYMNTPQITQVKDILNSVIQKNQININIKNLNRRLTLQENIDHLTNIVNGNINISENINGTNYPLYRNGGSNFNYTQNLGNILIDNNQGTHSGNFNDMINEIINVLELKQGVNTNSRVLVVDLENVHSKIVKVVKKSQFNNNNAVINNPPTIYPILTFMEVNNFNRVIFVYKDPNKWNNISFLIKNMLSARNNFGNVDQNIMNVLPPPNLQSQNNIQNQMPTLDRHINFLNNLSPEHFIGIDLSSSPQSRPPQLFVNYNNDNLSENIRNIQKLYYGFDDLTCFSIASFLYAIQIPISVITYDMAFNLNEYQSYFQNINSEFPILFKLKKLRNNGELENEMNSRKYLAELAELDYQGEIQVANIDNAFNIVRISQQQQFVVQNYQEKYKALPKETIIKNLKNLVKLVNN
jgi:hypothetical protein